MVSIASLLIPIISEKPTYALVSLILILVFGTLTLGFSIDESNNLEDSKEDFTYKITVPNGNNNKSYYTDSIDIEPNGSICLDDYYISKGFPDYELKHKTRTIKLNGYTLEGPETCN